MKTAGIFFKRTLFYGVFILFLCLFTNLYSGGFGYDKRCANCGLLSVTHVSSHFFLCLSILNRDNKPLVNQ